MFLFMINKYRAYDQFVGSRRIKNENATNVKRKVKNGEPNNEYLLVPKEIQISAIMMMKKIYKTIE